MNLYISAQNAVIFALSCAAGVLVYHRTKTPQSSTGPATRGDLAAAVTTAAATLLLLAFLFGLGDGSSVGAEPTTPKQPTVGSTPPSR